MSLAISRSDTEHPPRRATTEPGGSRARGWKLWLAPRPFTVVSTAVYLGVLYFTFLEYCESCGETWKAIVSLVSLVGLLALDRLDYLLYGEVPPARAGFLLLALRFVLAATVTALLDWLIGAYIFALFPYIATYYFRIRGTVITALASWLAMAVLIALWILPTLSRVTVSRGDSEYSYYLITSRAVSEYVSNLSLMTVMLVFGAGAARVAYLEKANRRHVEQLLARLESSNASLRARSEEALAATEYRSRAARDIHDRVGHYLAEVDVQLEKAQALNSRDSQAAEQAVVDAKQSVSQALHDIRVSVASLRRDTTIPAYSDESGSKAPAAEIVPNTGHAAAREPGRAGKWLRWLAPRPFDVVSTTLYLGMFVATLAAYDPMGESRFGQHAAMAVFVLGLILIDRLEYLFFGERPPLPAGLLLFGLRLAIWSVLLFVLGSWYALWLLALVPYFCFVYFGAVTGYSVSAILGLALVALNLTEAVSGTDSIMWEAVLQLYLAQMLVFCFLLASVIATSHIVVKERNARAEALRLLADLDKSGEELATRTQQALAAVNARNSLARDIHDGLGHYLTAMGVQLEKALAFRSLDPAAADQATLDSRRLASEALREIRGTVGTLSLTEPQEASSLVVSLRDLADRLSESGIEVDLLMEGSDEGYSAQAIMALYRVSQEGITNIRKHSGARRVSIHLWLGERAAHLEITDDGRGFDPPEMRDTGQGANRDRGYGLQSMAERLELVGGSLKVESAPGRGTRLHIIVPSVLYIASKASRAGVAGAATG
jgi:signal transduction histidine kinase